MCCVSTASPAKILRSVKRITHFTEKRWLQTTPPALPKPLLSINFLQPVDVLPITTVLTFSAPNLLSISPVRRILSRRNQLATECVPGLINEDEQTISTYIDGFTHETIFICKLCNTDHYRSTPEIKKHIREVHKIVVRPIMNYNFEPTFECLP